MYVVYKNAGETPLHCLQRLFPTNQDTYTYAGRLDPMAEGLLLVLQGDECKNASQYYHLEKTYEYTFLLGIATDTYDCLGRITNTTSVVNDNMQRVHDTVQEMIGTLSLPYPPYSSKTVAGIPLFKHARQNTLPSITIPQKNMQITNHFITKTGQINSNQLVANVVQRISAVQGDFRQKASSADWQKIPAGTFPYCSATINCTGGTYVRAIVHEIGQRISCPTVTLSIKRTGIGTWTEDDVYGQ